MKDHSGVVEDELTIDPHVQLAGALLELPDEDFAASITLRSSRRLVATSPSVTTNSNLLTGIATCGNAGCGKGLTVVTGRSGEYHYYACARRATGGNHPCDGVRIQRKRLDDLVMDALVKRVVQPERLKPLLIGFLDVMSEATNTREQELRRSRTQETKLKDAIGGPYRLASVRNDIDRDEIFRSELDSQRRRHKALVEEIKSLER